MGSSISYEDLKDFEKIDCSYIVTFFKNGYNRISEMFSRIWY